MKLWKKHGTQPRFARLPEDFEIAVNNGGALVDRPVPFVARSAAWRPRPASAISSPSFRSAT